ncbi:MAG: hypothetical protein J6Q22_13245 [Prevotella sp.]|nr:hypothetical protein [Prevotella sp.]
MDAMIVTYPEAFDHCFNRLLQLVYNLIIIDNEPESIDDTFLKFCIFVNGKATFFRTDDTDGGELRALNGVPAETPDIYYMPVSMIVENPTFSKTYNLKRGEKCEVVYCRQIDRYTGGGGTGGLGSLIRLTAQLMADNMLSLNVAQKNTRLSTAIAADDEATKRSAEEAMRAMYAGEPFKVIMSNLVSNLQGIPVNVTTTNRYLIDLIQVQQYILAHFYEQIGLQTHDQMKKERLITDEINDNVDLSIYNIYGIIESINEGLDRVNAMFGTDMHAYLNPIIAKQLEQPAEGGGEENGQEESSSSGSTELDELDDNPGTEVLTDAAGISEPKGSEGDPEELPDDSSDGEPQSDSSEPEPDNEQSGEAPGAPGEPEPEEPEPEEQPQEINIEINIGGDPDEEQREDGEPVESNREDEPGDAPGAENDSFELDQPGEQESMGSDSQGDGVRENDPEPGAGSDTYDGAGAGEAQEINIEINIGGGEDDGPDPEESPDTVE